MRLIPQWRHSWRFSSNWFHSAQVALIAGWVEIPQDMKGPIPSWALLVASGLIFVLGLIARATVQDRIPSNQKGGNDP